MEVYIIGGVVFAIFAIIMAIVTATSSAPHKEMNNIGDSTSPIIISSVVCGHMQIYHNGLYVSEKMMNGPDSAGGIDIQVHFKNNTNKIIKYVKFTFIAFNAVGDSVSCRVTNQSEKVGEFTGPLNPGAYSRSSLYYGKMFYDPSIVRVKVKKAVIEFMDGTTEEMTC